MLTISQISLFIKRQSYRLQESRDPREDENRVWDKNSSH